MALLEENHEINFSLPFTRDGQTCWTLRFFRSPTPHHVRVALFWQDKDSATYAADIPRAGIEKLLDTLAPTPATIRKQKRKPRHV